MNSLFSKYLVYYPTVFLKGEFIPLFRSAYDRFQYLSPGDISQIQLKRGRQIVDFAMSHSLFYRERFKSVGLVSANDIKNLSDFRLLPSVTKKELIDNKKNIYTPWRYWSGTKTTGGSTGHPVQIKKNPGALARERVATWRGYRWAGVDIGDLQARFWGVPHTPRGRFKMKVTDAISNRVRISAFDLAQSGLERHYRTLSDFRPSYIYGYVSAIKTLADYMLDSGLEKIEGVRAVITTSEILTAGAREKIEQAFGCRVFNEYGCGEVGSIAHECEHGRMHIMADNLLVEIDAEPHKPGELIVTDFFNRATPLIRYRLGDFATFDKGPCTCGRGLPFISDVHGRAYDLVKTASGRTIHPESVIYVFEGIQAATGAITQFQVVQVSLAEFVVSIVPAESWNSSLMGDIRNKLFQCLGVEVSVKFDLCESIPREASGKMRLVKSLL